MSEEIKPKKVRRKKKAVRRFEVSQNLVNEIKDCGQRRPSKRTLQVAQIVSRLREGEMTVCRHIREFIAWHKRSAKP